MKLSSKPSSPVFLTFFVIVSVIIIFSFASLSRTNNMGNSASNEQQQQQPPAPSPATALSGWQFTMSAAEGGATKFTLHKDGAAVSYKAVMESLAYQDTHLINTLSSSIVTHALSQNWEAVFWECKPVKQEDFAAAGHAFEFVVLNAPPLASKTANAESFKEHFDQPENANKLAIAFSNLGKDALLSVPTPRRASVQTYTHLLSFLRGASEQQVIALWQTVGQAFLTRMEQGVNHPLWLSTSGLGVYWLHVRNDKVPKYYNYMPFKSFYK